MSFNKHQTVEKTPFSFGCKGWTNVFNTSSDDVVVHRLLDVVDQRLTVRLWLPVHVASFTLVRKQPLCCVTTVRTFQAMTCRLLQLLNAPAYQTWYMKATVARLELLERHRRVTGASEKDAKGERGSVAIRRAVGVVTSEHAGRWRRRTTATCCILITQYLSQKMNLTFCHFCQN